MRVKRQKPFEAVQAAKDREKEFCDLALKDNILGRNRTRLKLWEEHLKRPNCSIGQSFEVLRESVSRLTSFSRHFVEVVGFQWLAAERVPKMWVRPQWEGVWPYLTRGTVCVYAQPPRIGMFRGSMGRMASSSCSF